MKLNEHIFLESYIVLGWIYLFVAGYKIYYINLKWFRCIHVYIKCTCIWQSTAWFKGMQMNKQKKRKHLGIVFKLKLCVEISLFRSEIFRYSKNTTLLLNIRTSTKNICWFSVRRPKPNIFWFSFRRWQQQISTMKRDETKQRRWLYRFGQISSKQNW